MKRKSLFTILVVSTLGLTSCSLQDVKSWVRQNIVGPAKNIISNITGNGDSQNDGKKDGDDKQDEQKVVLDTVTELAFASSDGTVEWASVKNATQYEYTVDGEEFGTTTATTLNIFDVVKNVTATQLMVRARSENGLGEFATLTFATKKLATPGKGKLIEDPKTHEEKIVWDAVEEASKYLVSVNDKNFVTYQTTEFVPNTKGDYYIKVKCKAYVKERQTVYLESDVSERSDLLAFIPGPALSIDALNVVSWTVEEEFDQYNVWVDGVKTKENVISPLNLVTGDDPILTKTGEYDIQIEAIKGSKSYWSNIQDEVGTSNINPGEIYSFDNRKLNKVVPSQQDPGWVITDEQAHTAPYSLYVPTQTQVNIQRYAASGINEIDFRTITKASYWVFIPEIPGYNETTLKTGYLPKIIYDGWGASALHARTVARAHEATVTIGEWNKVTFDIELQNSEILILGPGSKLTVSEESFYVPMYIDDISYDELEPNIEYDYKMRYDFDLCGGAWSNQPLRFHFDDEGKSKLLPPKDEYVGEADLTSAMANKQVKLSMDICGTASSENTFTIGFGAFNNAEHTLTGCYKALDRSLISTLEYKHLDMVVQLDEHGDFYTTIYEFAQNDNEAVTIFLKDVTCESVVVFEPCGDNGNNADKYYQSIVALKADAPENSLVTVSMDVMVAGTFNSYSHVWWVEDVYSVAGGEFKTGTKLDDPFLTQEGWHHVEFEARVKNFTALRYNSAYPVKDLTDSGPAVYLISMNKSATSIAYKNVNVEFAAPSFAPGGDNGNTANPYYQSLAVLEVPTDYPVGANVAVEMDVKVTGTFDEYSDLYAVTSTYSDNAVNEKVNIKSEIINGETGWHHVSFVARAIKLSAVKFNGSFSDMDTSTYDYAVYLIARNKTVDSVSYTNVQMEIDSVSLINGGANNTGNGFYQSVTGLKTSLEVGSNVVVEMDVKVTGTFDQYSDIWWIDTVWSVSGGERNAATSIKSLVVTGDSEWHHISFSATVRNFPVLRNNASQYSVADTSMFGNAVYLLTQNKSYSAMDYKNLSIEPESVLQTKSGGANSKGNGFYQSMTGLTTELEVGTSVTVEMDVNVTGTFNEYSYISWVNEVWSTSGGESDKSRTHITSLFTDVSGWHHISFTATIRNFSVLRWNTQYTATDTSEFGNAVYIITQNTSVSAFSYKNVTITAAE